MWILGVSQLLKGRADRALASLAHTGLISFAAVAIVAVVAYAVSYRTHFMRIPERIELPPNGTLGRHTRLWSMLDRTMLRTAFQRACYRFAIKTLLRSDRHCLALGAAFGVGIVISSQTLFYAFSGNAILVDGIPSADVLSIPLTLTYCLMVGLRIVLDMPAELRANWVFKFTLDADIQESRALVTRLMLSLVFPWLWGVVLPSCGFLWGWKIALLYTLVVTGCCIVFAQALALRCRKVPFACTYPKFKNHAVLSVLACAAGLFVFAKAISTLIRWTLSKPIRVVVFLPLMLLGLLIVRQMHKATIDIDNQLIFEESPAVAVELLGLSGS